MSKKGRLRLDCWQLTSWVCKVSWEGSKPSAELPGTRTNILWLYKLYNAVLP